MTLLEVKERAERQLTDFFVDQGIILSDRTRKTLARIIQDAIACGYIAGTAAVKAPVDVVRSAHAGLIDELQKGRSHDADPNSKQRA